MAIFPLAKVRHLKYLWIYPLAVIPKMGRNLRLIYSFSWRILNSKVHQAAPKEYMRFGRALNILPDCILWNKPMLGPDLLRKFDLADAYMRI